MCPGNFAHVFKNKAPALLARKSRGPHSGRLGAKAELVDGRKPELSVYLGHVKPQQSYWYFTATPELLRAAGESFQSFANTRAPS
jgi:hypothetical protein